MKNNTFPLPLTICIATVLSGCSLKSGETQSDSNVPAQTIVATVNGKAITENAVKGLKTETAIYNKRINVTREQLLRELINRELLYQQAVKHQLDLKPEVLDRIETAKRAILFKSEMQDFMNKTTISDAELKAEYDRQLQKSAEELAEYKGSHILSQTENEAKKVITLLNKGKKFSTLAKQFSTDTSAKKGGELGWFSKNQMVPEFSNAINQLQNGEYTRKPVRSGHGWHVILREDSRKKQPPPLASVEKSLTNQLKRIKFQAYIQDLKKNAEITQTLETVSKVSGATLGEHATEKVLE